MKKKESRFLFLGTGGSLGTPVVSCHCAVCKSKSSFNKRLRPASLLTINNKKLLLDAGPDIRTQLLTHRIDSLDGLIVTHGHHDHTAGIDDLRAFKKEELPCLMSQETLTVLKDRFGYIFSSTKPYPSLLTKFNVQILQGSEGHCEFEGVSFDFLSFKQGDMTVNGFRFGNLAYLSDIKDYSETIFNHLHNLDILIVSALRYTPTPLHLTVDEAVAFAKKVGAKETWFTHIAHELDYVHTNAYLPPTIRLAYDGLEISFS